MRFAEKLKQLRQAADMTQPEVAEKIGVSYRMYQYYETGGRYPQNASVYSKIAELFNVDTNFLLSDEDRYIIEAAEKGGSKSKKDMQALVADLGSMFAGGELTEDDKDKAMRAINNLYWKAKENNKKYTRKDYLKKED